MGLLGDLFVRVGADIKGFQHGMHEVHTGIEDLAKYSEVAAKLMSAALGAVSFKMLIDGAIEAGEVLEKASIKIQRMTGATGAALEGLEENFKNLYRTSAQSGDNIAGALSLISVRTGAVGEELEALVRNEMRFAKVTGMDLPQAMSETQKAFAQWGVGTGQQSVALDILGEASRRSAVPMAEFLGQFLSMGPILREMKFGFEESAALIGTFGRAGLDATTMQRGLNAAFVTFTKAGKEPRAALLDLIARLGDAKTHQAALMELIEIFGKRSSGVLDDAIKRGAFNFKEFKKWLDESRGSTERLSAATTTLNEEWTKFGHQAGSALMPIGEAVLKWSAKVIGAFNHVAEKLGFLKAMLLVGVSLKHPKSLLALGDQIREAISAATETKHPTDTSGLPKPSEIGTKEVTLPDYQGEYEKALEAFRKIESAPVRNVPEYFAAKKTLDAARQGGGAEAAGARMTPESVDAAMQSGRITIDEWRRHRAELSKPKEEQYTRPGGGYIREYQGVTAPAATRAVLPRADRGGGAAGATTININGGNYYTTLDQLIDQVFRRLKQQGLPTY